ncbi:hypothetical protein KY320_03600 [Candidatus Woesearchaeota archaeon]|nr:hypothetical protein [Candidatus Woesearchaeota archaeon]
MIGVEHKLAGQAIKREVSEIRMLLSNNRGSYLMLPSGAPSRYDGFFVYDQSMFKIIDSLGLSFAKLVNHSTSADIGSAKLALHPKFNALQIKTKKQLTIDFDVRHSYDARIWGRNYCIEEQGKSLLVKFVKSTDSREDQTHGQMEYEFYIAIVHDGTHTLLNNWVEKNYDYDRQRNSKPFERFVYRAVQIDAKNILTAVSRDKGEALNNANNIFGFKITRSKSEKISEDKDINLAYNSARKALDHLTVNGRIFAGLPWFFQTWTRDEAISVGALIAQHRYAEAKNILFRELNFVEPDGRLANRFPKTETGSADALGWCLFRLKQIIGSEKLDKTENIFLKAKLDYVFERFQKNFIKNNLAYNGPKETWMDTEYNGDDRQGARIEIQAMQLSLYKLLHQLSGQKQFKDLETEIKARLRKEFWDGEKMADGLGDFTQRPNIFIAYYIYPDLFPREEWTKCFDAALKELWLEWGGLATISKNHSLFHDKHTGENHASYHRGDSWYWINNLAAICMYRVNKIKYKEKIFQIMQASTDEILWSGAAGHHAELSSANKEESQGCFSQAWSMGMYIELIQEMFG